MRRILVTGANGQLGNAMRLLGATSRNEYRFTDVAELDITDEEAVRRAVCDGRIDVIVNCAAYTNVDRAEEDEATADRINRLAVGNLARAAAAADATLIHVSTDYVFSGDANRPYDETCETHPLGVYGRTKLAGEAEVEQSGCKSLIIRTAWLYSEFGHNFLKTMLRLTAERDRLTVVFDQAGTPTYAGDLARTIFDIVERGLCRPRRYLPLFERGGLLVVRLRPRHCRRGGPHAMHDRTLPLVGISVESRAPGLFGAGQEQDQGDVRGEDPPLDGVAQSMYEKP